MNTFLFPPNLLKEIEYFKILEKIASFSSLQDAKNKILNIKPISNPEEIKTEFDFLQEIETANNIKDIPQPPDNIKIIKQKINSNAEFLTFEELIPTFHWLLEYKNWFLTILEKKELRLLNKELNLINEIEALLSVLTKFFTTEGKWKPHIHSIFKKLEDKISETQSQLNKKISKVLKKYKTKGYTDAETFTIRNNRFVIPVHSQYKTFVTGIYHDVSNSGLTIYIEPDETTELQNKLGFLKMKLNNEVRKILIQISEELRTYKNEFNNLYEFHIYIEIALAKLQWQNLVVGNVPKISKEIKIKLVNARNPYLILQKGYENVVPFDMEIDNEKRIIVISGPNAGGKSITLKAVLLNILLFQSGIPIPVGQSSELFIFNKVFADIGDRQSADEELSTYSAKLKFLNILVSQCDKNSIFFIDELGSGTAPEFGGAIARAFLENVISKNCIGLVTTHYEIIKALAQEHKNLQNAAMEFDLEELKPTYKFIQNKTGRSFALEIADRIGTPKFIIDNAIKYINKNVWNAEKILTEARKKEQQLNKLLQEQKELNKKLQKEIQKLKQKKQQLIQEQEKIIKQTQSKAHKLISEIKQELQSKRSIKQSITKISEKIYELRESIEENQPPTNQQINIGDTVQLKGSDSVAKVNKVLGDEVEIILGNIRMIVPITDIIKSDKKVKEHKKKTKEYKIISDVKTSIDLRGLTTEQAIPELDKWLNKLITANVKKANIIHGKGTFALKNNIRKFLQEHYSEFFKFYDGENEGITTIELR